MSDSFALVIHGGAGAFAGRDYSSALAKLRKILQEVGAELANGGSCLDAVANAVVYMEDSGLYTAGRGSSPNSEGNVELDASIMAGETQRAGAIAAVRAIKNPIHGARKVMEASKHVLLVGEGAEKFLRQQNCAFVENPNAYFHGAEPDFGGRIHGTVGAVARDCSGRLAAATSTGGIFHKLAGRVGDSPIPGAGVWADSRIAVSCTGHGEYFLRTAAAHEIAAIVEYKGLSLVAAVDEFLQVKLLPLGGDGGAIAVDNENHIAASFTGYGMKYGWITHEHGPETELEISYASAGRGSNRKVKI